MIKKYDISESIPIPHDCVITRIVVEHEYMVFTFENELYTHDSIQAIHPSANSLIMRFHLTHYQGADDFRLYVRKAGKRHEGYKRLKNDELLRFAQHKGGLQYLYHYVGSKEMIIHFCSDKNYVLYVCTDRVDFNWIESQEFIQ